jgi:glycosyltransferase involved in cell wall biosynthesis
VIVPVYNEEGTIGPVLRRVLEGPYPDKEVIVVDDGSTDATPQVLAEWSGRPGLVVLRHAHNLGKGSAVRTGLRQARGLVTLIQDADLEYDPADYPRLVEPLLAGSEAVVYGSRYLSPSSGVPWTRYRLAVSGLNLMVWLLFGQRLTDEATCYKAMPTELFRRLQLEARRFELCPEVTAKVCRLGLRIAEVPVAYHPRGVVEGKKIGWRDALEAAWALLRWRVRPLPGR